MKPVDALKRIENETMNYYPLGEFKNVEGL